MRILTVAAELAPLAKTGGLADAVAGLTRALARRGHDVRVLLPRYGDAAAAGGTALPTQGAHPAPFRYAELPADGGPRVYCLELSEPPAAGEIYSGDERDGARYIELSAAAAALPAAAGWQPDLVHCHDWHAALVPVLARRITEKARAPCILTLHNVGYQGWFPPGLVERSTLLRLDELVETGGTVVNFLREGIRAADYLTTVSPTYAHEIQTPAFGMGLEDLLAARAGVLTGILNGVDYETWSPESDPHLPEPFGAHDLAPKARLKQTLCAALGLAGGDAPLVGVVTRLVPQKGIDLLADALPELLATTPAAFALLGSGDPALSERLREFAREHPARFSFTHGYDETLAHRILAGSDLVAVPSRYEPCGLTQLYALRYGTVPVVRATGGLADSVSHFDPASGTGTGSVFRDADVGGLLWGLRTALGWYDDRPGAWARVVANAMACDFSWEHQVREYEALYARVLATS